MQTISGTMLDEVVRRLVAEFAPDQIILFSSRASGTQSEDGDIDRRGSQ